MPQDTILVISLITLAFGVFALALAYGERSTHDIRRD
jgi:hypothetical protein